MRKEKPRWLVRLGIVRTGLIGTGLAYALGLGVAVARPEATLAFFSQSHQEDMTVNLASDFTIRPKLIIEAPAFKRLAPTPNQKAGVKTASAAPIVLPSTYTALLGPGRTYNPSDVDTASLTLCLGSQFCGGLGIKPTTITFTDQAVRAVFSQNDLGQLLAEVKADAQVDLSLSGTTKSVGRPVVGTTTLKIIEIVPPTMTPTPTSTPTKQTPTASVTGTVIPTGTLAPTGTARPIITPNATTIPVQTGAAVPTRTVVITPNATPISATPTPVATPAPSGETPTVIVSPTPPPAATAPPQPTATLKPVDTPPTVAPQPTVAPRATPAPAATTAPPPPPAATSATSSLSL